MRKIQLLFIILISTLASSQNKQLLYNFNSIPQSLLTNPGTEIDYKWHMGIPALSGISLNVGTSAFSAYDLFAKSSIDFNTKLRTVLSNSSSKDALMLNEQLEIIQGGYIVGDSINNKAYVSFGLYQEFDLLTYFPKDIVILALDGNKDHIGKSFDFSHVNLKAELISVYHVGYQKKMNEKLTLGGRFKLYNSNFNIKSTNNKGYLYTIPGTKAVYEQSIYTDLEVNTSGIAQYFGDDSNPKTEVDPNKIVQKTFVGGSVGLGIDAGFTYTPLKRIQITASVIDLGFINQNDKVKNYVIKGSYQYDGVNPDFEAASTFENVFEKIKEKIAVVENDKSYITWRPTKINASLQYSFGQRKSEECDCNNSKSAFRNDLGAHLFLRMTPKIPIYALTAYLKKEITNKLQIKATYTIDSFTNTNIGLGLSAQLGLVEFYILADNMLSYKDISKSNELSLQFGINLIHHKSQN
jgi:Family of unknown function (DUF5723)